jgi:site-specific DNA-methyltransferase (adenine-specific)
MKERSYSTNNQPPGFKGIVKEQDEFGRWFTMASMRDIWEINAVGRSSSERIGYATQKPLELLTRIIKASSNEGDVVLDPFCGCATTIEAAQRMKRHWMGIDIAIHAINRVSRDRLKNRLNLAEGQDYLIEGIPISHEGAVDLWKQDHFEFQKWAVEEVDGFMTNRKTGDGGIDGRIYFEEPNNKDLQSMVLEVKGGKSVNVNILRDLRGVLDREGERKAGLILLHKLSDRKRKNFEKEIATAGFVEIDGKSYPRMQILTIDEILDGQRFNIPGYARGRSSTAELRLL